MASRRQFLKDAIVATAAVSLSAAEEPARAHSKPDIFQFSLPRVMGTRLEFLAVGTPDAVVRPVWDAFYAELMELDAMLNRFNGYGEVARLNADPDRENVQVSERLSDLLRLARSYRTLTGGLFDIALGRPWKITEDGKVSLHGARLDFGGFAKGYALRLLRARLSEAGIGCAFTDFGGSSILATGRHPYGDCWKVGVTNPYGHGAVDEWDLVDTSLSTSGNTPGYDGHIVNPSTGERVSGRRMVSVRCPDPLDAEVLSTALMLATPSDEKSLASAFPDAVFRRYDL